MSDFDEHLIACAEAHPDGSLGNARERHCRFLMLMMNGR